MYFADPDDPEYKDYQQVSMVRKDRWDGDAVKCDTYTDWYTDEWTNPILLTEEILEKSGFIRTHEDMFDLNQGEHSVRVSHTEELEAKVGKKWYVFIKYHFGRQTYEDGFDLSVDNIVKVYFDYVHELQHALTLAGIEKEIKL